MSQQTQTLEQVIIQMRDNISRTHSNAEYSALSSFDKLVEQLKVFASQINEKSAEITRLQQLCTKNKIDHEIKPPVITPKKS